MVIFAFYNTINLNFKYKYLTQNNIDFLNSIDYALNSNSNGVSSSFNPNANGVAAVFNNNTIPNAFPPMVNSISPSVSNIFKTIQQIKINKILLVNWIKQVHNFIII